MKPHLLANIECTVTLSTSLAISREMHHELAGWNLWKRWWQCAIFFLQLSILSCSMVWVLQVYAEDFKSSTSNSKVLFYKDGSWVDHTGVHVMLCLWKIWMKCILSVSYIYVFQFIYCRNCFWYHCTITMCLHTAKIWLLHFAIAIWRRVVDLDNATIWMQWVRYHSNSLMATSAICSVD